MTTIEAPSFHSSRELIDALATARDRARVQLHLLSLDARDSWHELESKIDNLQANLENDGDRLTESATKKVRELTRSVKEMLQQHGAVAELATPAEKLMRPAHACRASDTLNEAARLMWEFDCGAVPVVNDEGRLVGIITDRDICMAAYTRGQTLSDSTVESVMATHVTVVAPKDTLEAIIVLMKQRQVRRIPVVDEGHLVGIVSLADIARHLETESGPVLALDLARTLKAISEPRPPVN